MIAARFTRRPALTGLLALALLAACPALAATTNRPNKPAVATFPAGTSDLFVSITGRGFGTTPPGASLAVTIIPITGSASILSIPSTDPAVQLWMDGQIVVKLPASNVRRLTVVVLAPGVAPSRLKVVKYGYETYDTSAVTPGGINGLVVDSMNHAFNAHRVFYNLEFHSKLGTWVPQAGASVEPLPGSVQPLPGYPTPAVPCFRSLPFNGNQIATTQSAGGDNAIVDSFGRVWFNEYGFGPDPSIAGSENLPNHTRLLAFDASNPIGPFRLYNIPGDQSAVTSMAWDQQRGRIWFTLQGPERQHRLVVFNPDSLAIPHDDFGFDWTTTRTCVQNLCQPLGFSLACQTDADCVLADEVCPPGTTVDQATDCYLEIPLPPSFTLGSQVIRSLVYPRDGSVWMTNYFLGAEVVRFDPGTGDFLHVPLPRPAGKPDPFLGNFPPTPVDLKLTSNGDLVYNTQVGDSVGYIRSSMVLNPGTCTQLESDVAGAECEWRASSTPPIFQGPDVSCTNPCITETLVSNSFVPCTPASRSDATCPWTSVDQNGSLYFSWITRDKRVWLDIAGRGVGYIRAQDLARGKPSFVLFPPFSVYPGGQFSCAGGDGNLGAIAVDESTSTVWYGEYCRKRLARHFPIK